jgi:hypothetical protein
VFLGDQPGWRFRHQAVSEPPLIMQLIQKGWNLTEPKAEVVSNRKSIFIYFISPTPPPTKPVMAVTMTMTLLSFDSAVSVTPLSHGARSFTKFYYH